jgi:small subunit ribosomal protein S9
MADGEEREGVEEPEAVSEEQPQEVLLAEDAAVEAPETEPSVAEHPDAAEQPSAAEQPAAEQAAPVAEEPAPVAEEPAPVAEQAPVAEEPATQEAGADDEEEPAPREKPAVPGAHLEVDIVPEGVDPLGRSEGYEDAYAVDPYALDEEADAQPAAEGDEDEREEILAQPIATAAIDLASGARYRATGKRKSAIARVTLRPGTGSYLVNGRTLEAHFPRRTLQRNIRQPLETVGYEDRMDVVARLHGGGISAQAGALRHGVSRALLEADPNLRGELKRRGFLTRDSRAKERKKAGLKKARKRPQFSKR